MHHDSADDWRGDPDADADPFDALFAADVARDVRDEFVEQHAAGGGVAGATAAVVQRFRHLLGDPAEGPVVILALAAMQLRHRQLHASLRDAAVDLLNDPATLAVRPGEPSAFRAERDRLRRSLLRALRDAAVVGEA